MVNSGGSAVLGLTGRLGLRAACCRFRRDSLLSGVRCVRDEKEDSGGSVGSGLTGRQQAAWPQSGSGLHAVQGVSGARGMIHRCYPFIIGLLEFRRNGEGSGNSNRSGVRSAVGKAVGQRNDQFPAIQDRGIRLDSGVSREQSTLSHEHDSGITGEGIIAAGRDVEP